MAGLWRKGVSGRYPGLPKEGKTVRGNVRVKFSILGLKLGPYENNYVSPAPTPY